VTSDATGTEWPTLGGGEGDTRYSVLTEINKTNVRNLGGAWIRELPNWTRTPPFFADGILYISDAATLYALNPKTGETIWEYTPEAGVPAQVVLRSAGVWYFAA
jgi:quinohemoprotein ethanol dehydrogenase